VDGSLQTCGGCGAHQLSGAKTQISDLENAAFVWIKHCTNSVLLFFYSYSFPRLQESGECLMIWACNETFADICYVPLGKAGVSMLFPDSGHSISGQRLPYGDVR